MESKIIYLEKNKGYRSLLINEYDFWYSMKKLKDVESFKKAIKKSSNPWNRSGIVKYNEITEITMSESSEVVRLDSYNRNTTKNLKLYLFFLTEKEALHIGKLIASKTKLIQKRKRENIAKLLLIKGFWIALTAASTWFFVVQDDDFYENNEGSSKAKLFKNLLRIIRETVGETGIAVIGGLITLALLYQLVKRLREPKNDITYTRGPK